MPIELIDKIKPKNGQCFPLVEAADVEMPDGTRLSDFSPHSPQIQFDYAQNDSTAADYIKNRPFYEGEPTKIEFPLRETIFAQQTLNGFTYNENFGVFGQGINILSPIVLGETYKVVWDDEEYIVTAQDTNDILSNSIAFGDLSSFGLTGNNEPFAMIWWDGLLSVGSLTDTEATPHNVAIYKEPVFIYGEGEGAFIANGTPSPEMLALWNSDWKNCVFTWDGVEHTCEPQTVQGVKCIGNVGAMMGTGDSGEPFIVMCADTSLFGIDIWMIYDLATEITGTIEEGATTAHEVGLVINAPNIAKLDPKYLKNIDYETQVINKPFGTTPSGTVLFDKTVVCDEEGQAEIDYIKLVEGITYTAEIDETVYTAVASANGGLFFLNLDDDHALITFGGATILSCPAGEHTVKVALDEDVVKKLDKKYLPDDTGGSGLPEVTADDNGKFLRVVDGVWTAVSLTNVAEEGA